MRLARLPFIALLLVPSMPQAGPKGGAVTGKVDVVDAKTRNAVPNPTNVWVYLKLQNHRMKPKGVRSSIEQVDKKFVPSVRVVPVGSTIDFPNKDKTTKDHNVFSPTAPSFDLQRYGPGKSKEREFLDEGEYAIYCDIHKQMSATVKVVDTDLMVEVKNGTYSLSNVPAGKYKVFVWTPNSEEVTDTITVVDGDTATVALLHLRAKAPPDHLNKNNQAYPSCQYDPKQCKP